MRTLAFVAALALAGLMIEACGAAGGGVVARIDVGGEPCGVAGASGSVWVSDAANAELLRIDPSSNELAARTKLDATPCEIHPAFGSLWVVTQSGRVDRVEPRGGAVVAHIPVGRVTQADECGAAASARAGSPRAAPRSGCRTTSRTASRASTRARGGALRR